MAIRASRLAFGAALASVAAAQAASAAPDLFSGDQLRGFIDFRAAASDSEQSWTDDGFGKTRFSGDDGDVAFDGLAQGMLIWRPHLTWNVDGYVTLQADTEGRPAIDVVEAFASYRGAPSDGWRFSGRAGLMYPPVSLEHDGPGWTPTDTITPSAINSWIGEEVKIVGVEASARRRFETQEFAATLGLFGFNDTSGTLLAYRGWALGDFMPGARGEVPLPTRSFAYQDYTKPTTELDDRVGYYARLEYRPIGPLTFDVTHYDNAGDRISDAHGQTDWETRFTNIGLRAALGPDTHLLAQAMTGQTIWGERTPMGYWTDVDFASAYVLIAHDFGGQSIAGRLDYFEVTDRSFVVDDNNDEQGWAATAAYQLMLSPQARLAFEGLHVSSDRPTRADLGIATEQDETTLQSSLKLSF